MKRDYFSFKQKIKIYIQIKSRVIRNGEQVEGLVQYRIDITLVLETRLKIKVLDNYVSDTLSSRMISEGEKLSVGFSISTGLANKLEKPYGFRDRIY